MKIILGLGNPGSRYARTRHNVGWMVLDAVAEKLGLEFNPGKGDYYVAEGSWQGKRVALIKPTTWMNHSGIAAHQAMIDFNSRKGAILVVLDKFQFPLGKIKMTPGGSSGGHNGLDSVLTQLKVRQEERLPRLRIGVGKDFGPGEMVQYVLSPFRDDEQEMLKQVVPEARDAVLLWVAEGTVEAISKVNASARKQKNASDKLAAELPEEDQQKSVADSRTGQSDNTISTKS